MATLNCTRTFHKSIPQLLSTRSKCPQAIPLLSSVSRPIDMRIRSVSQATGSSRKSNSIWDSDESSWDHVFKDLDTLSNDKLVTPVSEPNKGTPRAQRMTAREVDAFGTMFDMIFKAVSPDLNASTVTSSEDNSTPGTDKGDIGGFAELALNLRRRSRSIKWTSETDQELDRKKEQMHLCNTDQELLEWTVREVFGESQRYQSYARTSEPSMEHSQKTVYLQPPSYPYLIAILMRTFRDKYADPYLALSIFDHARHLSVASYVFGCTVHAYNELVETRWRCFRDLRGVCSALEEMRVNGIEMDSKTRALAELVRREVGARNIWQEEKSMENGEVWELVGCIERLCATQLSHSNKPNRKLPSVVEPWKQEALLGSHTPMRVW